MSIKASVSHSAYWVVHREDNTDEKYLMAISHSSSCIIPESEEICDEYLLPVNLSCCPEFTYYNSHCLFILLQ